MNTCTCQQTRSFGDPDHWTNNIPGWIDTFNDNYSGSGNNYTPNLTQPYTTQPQSQQSSSNWWPFAIVGGLVAVAAILYFAFRK